MDETKISLGTMAQAMGRIGGKSKSPAKVQAGRTNLQKARTMKTTIQKARKRLEQLRAELRAERISYGELAELESLIPYIDRDDVELLEAAGVPEESLQSTTTKETQ